MLKDNQTTQKKNNNKDKKNKCSGERGAYFLVRSFDQGSR